SHPFLRSPPPPPTSTLFPYTTLFRSIRIRHAAPCLAGAAQQWPGRYPENDPVAIRIFANFSRLIAFVFASGFRILEESAVYGVRSEEHTSELQSRSDLVCRLLLEKKK